MAIYLIVLITVVFQYTTMLKVHKIFIHYRATVDNAITNNCQN